MSIRRPVLAALCLAAAACGDGSAPSAPSDQVDGPHFLRWAPSALTEFSATGDVAASTATRSANGVQIADLTAETTPMVVVDQASSVTASTQDLSWSHTVGSGNNRFLLVGVSIRNGGKTVVGVTYAGKPLAFVGARNNSDNAVRAELWKLSAPPSGTATVSVSLSGSAKVVGGAVSFTGVDPLVPLGALASAGGTDNTVDPRVDLGTGVSDGAAFAVVALEGSAGSLTPSTGQIGQYSRFYGSSGGDVAGAGSVASGTATASMAWSKSDKAKWSIAAVVIRRAPKTGVAVDSYEASFWAVRGKSRTLQINYLAGGATSPYLRFTATDPSYVPGRGNLAKGDSVLITVRVDPMRVGAQFLPAGLQFDTPSSLKFWYGGLGGDLNGDGVVNATDTYIEQQLLGMWYKATPTSSWMAIAATVSTQERSVSSSVGHFSEYAVSW